MEIKKWGSAGEKKKMGNKKIGGVSLEKEEKGKEKKPKQKNGENGLLLLCESLGRKIGKEKIRKRGIRGRPIFWEWVKGREEKKKWSPKKNTSSISLIFFQVVARIEAWGEEEEGREKEKIWGEDRKSVV